MALPTPPPHLDPTAYKVYSTNECTCINDDLSPAQNCLDCWGWENFDLLESIEEWFRCQGNLTMVLENVMPRDSNNQPTRVTVGRNHWSGVLVDWIADLGGDFTMLYQAPDPQQWAWHFWKFSPLHPPGQEWQQCRVFASAVAGMDTIDTPWGIKEDIFKEDWVDNRLEELARVDPYFASFNDSYWVDAQLALLAQNDPFFASFVDDYEGENQ